MYLSRPVHLLLLACAVMIAGCGASSAPAERRSDTSISAPDPVPVAEVGDSERRAAEEFFRGKVVRIVVGSGAGGGFDTTARLVARHLSKHIPGKPLVIVENMPGGGGLVAANHIFHAAPRDALTMGIFHEAQVLNQLTGADGVQFDLRKFNWLGSSYDDPNVCLVRTDASAQTFEDLISGERPIAVGGTGPGSNTYDVPRVLAAATGARIRAIAGYPTTNDVRVGVERGELQGVCFGWESVQSSASQWIEDDYARILVQNGRTKHEDLPEVPLASEFAKDEDSRRFLALVDAPGSMAKPFALPPGVEASRVNVLREALQATYADPALLQEASAMRLHFQPKTATEIQRLLNEVLDTPEDLVAKFNKIIEP